MPELATHWTVSADGRTYTFHLRDDVKWVRWHNTELDQVTEAAKEC